MKISLIFAPEMKLSYKILFALFVAVLVSMALPEFADAQCAMCKAAAESNQQAKGEQHFGANLNTGILYLMAVPYMVLAFLAFLFFKKGFFGKAIKFFRYS